MDPDELRKRFRQFALRCIRLVNSFPRTQAAEVIGYQLIKCSTSAAANYRSACAGRSKADFIAKLGIVHEETDESLFWIDLAPEAGLVERELVTDLLDEADQLVSIVVASLRTSKRNRTLAE